MVNIGVTRFFSLRRWTHSDSFIFRYGVLKGLESEEEVGSEFFFVFLVEMAYRSTFFTQNKRIARSKNLKPSKILVLSPCIFLTTPMMINVVVRTHLERRHNE